MLIAAFFPSASHANDQADLERRVKALERKLKEAMLEAGESDRQVRSFLPTGLIMGGFFESSLLGLSQPGQDLQLASDENILGINIGAEFSEDWRFVSQFLTGLNLPVQNRHNDSRGPSVGLPARREFRDFSLGTLISQGYLQWSHSERLNVQGGLGYVPFGITPQQLELVLFVRRGGPQQLRTTGLVHPLWQGLNVHGRVPVLDLEIGYSFYTFSPQLNPKVLGTGSRFWWRSYDDKLQIGISEQNGSRADGSYVTLGPDLRFRWKQITLTTELAKSLGKGPQPWAFHVQPEVDVFQQSVLLYSFADYTENPLNRTGLPTTGLPDPVKEWQFGTGVNWLPTSFTRLRSGITVHDYVGSTSVVNGQNRDYLSLDLSGGVAF